MQKTFLYIDESKNIIQKKLFILVYQSNKKLGTLNNTYNQLKIDYRYFGEIHGFRRKEVQFLWKDLESKNYWNNQKNIENIFFFEFDNFEEKGFKWKNVYEFITNIIESKGQIYADKITLSDKDMAQLKLSMVLKGFNIEFLHSGNNSSIQIADMIYGFCYHNKDSQNLGSISIQRIQYTLGEQ